MMKNTLFKIIIATFALLIFSTAFSFARETNLGDVSIRFCNDKSIPGGTKSLELSTETNKEEEICIYMNNAGSTPAKLGINFVDGSTTPDEEAKKACEPEGIKTNFGQYVKAEDTEFLVPAGGTLQTTVKLKFPTGVAGNINGCITYNLLDQSLSGDGMFKVFSRRANFIDVIVSGEIIFNTTLSADTNKSLENITDNTQISLYHNKLSKTMSLKSWVINSGNLPSITQVSGDISGWFGLLHQTIAAKKITTNAHKKSVYEYDLPKRSIMGGAMNIKLYVDHTPIFPKGFDNTNIKGSSYIIELSAILIPRWIYCIIGTILIAIIVNRKHNDKK